MLDIDTAIKHCLDVAEQNDTQADKWREEGGEQWGKTIACRECAADHRQLAEWLRELKDLREENKVLTSECDRLITEKAELLKQHEQIAEYKRLLKAAVEDFKLVIRDMLTCEHCKWFNAETTECSYPDEHTSCKKIAGWRHEGEALKLIGETNDEP